MKKIDTKKREEAFKVYLKLGSCNATARELGLPSPQIVRWSQEESWETRRKDHRKQLAFHFNSLKLAQENELTRLQLTELQFLEYLQTVVSEKIISGTIQPKSWRDVLDTQRFILNEMRLVLGQPTSISKVSTLTKISSGEDTHESNSVNIDGEELDKEELQRLIEDAHETLSDDE